VLNRGDDKLVVTSASRLLQLLLRHCDAAPSGSHADAASRHAYLGALNHFFHNRNSRMPMEVLNWVQGNAPRLALESMPSVTKEASSGRNSFKKVRGVESSGSGTSQALGLSIVSLAKYWP
jgi:hypothetical protein